MKLTDAIIEVFSIDGDLSRHIKGFRPRDEQLEMAQVVAEAIESKSTVIVEAGQEQVRLLLIWRLYC